MATKVYKSTDFAWSMLGGDADVSKLVTDSRFTSPPKQFYVQAVEDKKFKLLFKLVKTEQDSEWPDVISAWHYKTPHQPGYEDYEGAEITVYNI